MKKENRFENLVENAIYLIQSVNSKGQFVYVNNAWMKKLGYSKKQALTMSFPEIIKKEELSHCMQIFKNLSKGKLIEEIKTIFVSKSGKEIPVNGSIVSHLQKNKLIETQGIFYDISNERVSEEKYKNLFEKMLNGFALHKIVLDKKGKPINYIFLEINKAFETQTGLKKKNIIGEKVTKVLPGIEKDPAGWIKKYGKVALTQEEIKFEDYSAPLKKWYSVTAFSPKKNYFATIFEDITERKKAQEKYKLLYETSRDAIMILEPPTWKFTAGNPSAIKLFECEDEKEFTSRTPDKFSPKFQQDGQLSSEKAMKEITKAMKESSKFFEWTHKTLKGKEFPCTVLLTCFIKEGKPVLQATVRDITEQKKREKELKKSKEFSENILSTLNDGIDIIDENLNILYMNKNFLSIFGKKGIGKKCYNVYKDNKKQCEECPLKKPIKVGETKSIISSGVAGGKIFQINHTGILLDSGKKGILEVFRNITKEKKSTEELEKFNSFSIDRELKMIKLKKEINSLLSQLNKKEKYQIVK